VHAVDEELHEEEGEEDRRHLETTPMFEAAREARPGPRHDAREQEAGRGADADVERLDREVCTPR
jgi:hypothetical protein